MIVRVRALAGRDEQQRVQPDAVRGDQQLLVVAGMGGIAGRIDDPPLERRRERNSRRSQGERPKSGAQA